MSLVKRIVNAGFVGVFKEEFYSPPPHPPSTHTTTITDDDGSEITVVFPYVTGRWTAEYFYSPLRKMWMARTLTVMAVLTVLCAISSPWPYTFAVWGAMIIGSVICLNIGLRLGGRAIAGRVVPQLPFTNAVITFLAGLRDQALEDQVEETLVPRGNDIVVAYTHRERGGVLSPGTILAQWLNESRGQNIKDFVRTSATLLKVKDIKSFVGDDDTIWKDEKKIKELARITGSTAQQWAEAYDNYRFGGR